MTKRQAKPFTIAGFSRWLEERGAVIEPATSEWEVLRFRTASGVMVIYRNGKGRETWPEEASRLRDAFLSGATENLSPARSARTRLRGKIADLIRRDGPDCWFGCGVVFSGPDDDRITIEHLCPHAYGGPNHAANLCLSCEPCNAEAGNMHVVSKVALRDRNRAGRQEVAA